MSLTTSTRVPTAATRPVRESALLHAWLALAFSLISSPTLTVVAVACVRGTGIQSCAMSTSGGNVFCSSRRSDCSNLSAGDITLPCIVPAGMAMVLPVGMGAMSAAVTGVRVPTPSTSATLVIPNDVAVEMSVSAYSALNAAAGASRHAVSVLKFEVGLVTSPTASRRGPVSPQGAEPVAPTVNVTVSERPDALAITRVVPSAIAVTSPVLFTVSRDSSSDVKLNAWPTTSLPN